MVFEYVLNKYYRQTANLGLRIVNFGCFGESWNTKYSMCRLD